MGNQKPCYEFPSQVVDLPNYATYTVTLAAFTGTGEGPAHEYLARKSEEV